MATITLPPEIEERLTEEARKRGTTPELLALESLRILFCTQASSDITAHGNTLYEFLSGYVGAVSGTSEALSEDCGRRFAEGMTEKQQQGRL